MELVQREFAKIFEFYHVSDLGLVFEGYEWIMPDKILYYWQDPKNGDLYVIELADFVHEFMGLRPEKRIVEDFWPEHTCDWEVERWLANEETDDYRDYDKWFYWPECGDKCVMAKLKANVSDLKGRELERDIPDISEEEMTKRREELEGLIEIDAQRKV